MVLGSTDTRVTWNGFAWELGVRLISIGRKGSIGPPDLEQVIGWLGQLQLNDSPVIEVDTERGDLERRRVVRRWGQPKCLDCRPDRPFLTGELNPGSVFEKVGAGWIQNLIWECDLLVREIRSLPPAGSVNLTLRKVRSHLSTTR